MYHNFKLECLENGEWKLVTILTIDCSIPESVLHSLTESSNQSKYRWQLMDKTNA